MVMLLENQGLPLHFRTWMSYPISECFERKRRGRELHKVPPLRFQENTSLHPLHDYAWSASTDGAGHVTWF